MVLLDMAYNLGVNGLLKFSRTLRAIERGQWVEAGEEMKDSKWFEQVGSRAAEHVVTISGLTFENMSFSQKLYHLESLSHDPDES